MQLSGAKDPADEIYAGLLRPKAGRRFVELDLVIENQRGEGEALAVRRPVVTLPLRLDRPKMARSASPGSRCSSLP